MWPMPSWTRSWPAAANKACFSKQKPPRQSAGKRFCQGGFSYFSARCAVLAMLEPSPNAHPARPCGATAGHAQSRTPVQRGSAVQNKNGFSKQYCREAASGLRLPASISHLERCSCLAGRGPNSPSLCSPFCRYATSSPRRGKSLAAGRGRRRCTCRTGVAKLFR